MFLAAAVPIAAQQSKTVAVVCPASITVREAAVPVAGWTPEAANVKHEFERISVYNGTAGGKEYDLAPDTDKIDHHIVTQTWNLASYRDMNVFLRCRYRGTSAVLSMNLPTPLKACTFRYRAGPDGNMVADARMNCQ